MRLSLPFLASCIGIALAAPAAYMACTGDPGVASGLETCTRAARYGDMASIEAQRIITWEEYVDQYPVPALTTEQEQQLEETGDLVNAVTVVRPVKFGNGRIAIPAGWLPELPADHPWAGSMSPADATFAAYFEVRIVDPLLYDPPLHRAWAQSYFTLLNETADDMIASYIGADSGCP